MKSLRVFNTVQVVEASEFNAEDLGRTANGAIFVSQSGETADIYKALKYCHLNGVYTIGIVNTVSSLIARTVHCGVYVNCGREVAVAASKSFTCQAVTLILVAIFISKLKDTTN